MDVSEGGSFVNTSVMFSGKLKFVKAGLGLYMVVTHVMG